MNTSRKDSAEHIDNLCINAIRALSMDGIQKANSGHPGAPMALAPAGYVLWTRILKHNPQNPDWIDRDRFVLSAGHASMLIYSLLHLTGYDLDLDELRQFRQWSSKTPGHPEFGMTPGVETTTGPLGQGLANAVGMAVAERHMAAVYNRPEADIMDHATYVFCGDGDLMEGLSAEAASLAGHLALSRLIVIYDDNDISIEGSTDIAFTEDVGRRFEAYNWHVQHVDDGNDVDAIETALNNAKAENRRPSLIVLRTHIAYGSPNMQDTAKAHGSPLGEEEIRLTKENLGWKEGAFVVPENVMQHFRKCAAKGRAAEDAWQQRFETYRRKYPDQAAAFENSLDGTLADNWDQALSLLSETKDPIATRAASGKALNAIAPQVPNLVGGSADLAPSTKTYIEASTDFTPTDRSGRNIRFGVREHAMGALLSGMALHKGVRPYGGTFLVFSDYMRPTIRLAALMKLPVIYVFTHDSIAVGEDGPTHQPVEQIAALRAIPGLVVIRPADITETAAAWRLAVMNGNRPIALIMSRQKLPVLQHSDSNGARQLEKGAYILADTRKTPDMIIIATGAEVHLALEAGRQLAEKGIAARIVSMPSWELFDECDADYKRRILPPEIDRRLVVEAGVPMGWERYAGAGGTILGVNRFGASAPGGLLLEKFGFTVDNVVREAMALMDKG